MFWALGTEVEANIHGVWRRATITDPVVLGWPEHVAVRDERGDPLLIKKSCLRPLAKTEGFGSSFELVNLFDSPPAPPPVREIVRTTKPGYDLPVDHSAASEEAVQEKAIPALVAAGFRVLQASVRSFFCQCPNCGHRFRPERGTGQTPGIPDLFVQRLTGWANLWRGIEIKGPKTDLSDAQKQFLATDSIRVARSAEAAVMLAEQPGPDLSPQQQQQNAEGE